jgi:hypothetical protein
MPRQLSSLAISRYENIIDLLKISYHYIEIVAIVSG